MRRLDDIVVDIVTRELGYVTDADRITRAHPHPEQERERLDNRLESLLLQVVRSDLGLSGKKVVLAPVAVIDSALSPLATYLWESALETLPGVAPVHVIERERLEDVLKEHALDLAGLTEREGEVGDEIAGLLSADYLILSRLHYLGAARMCHMRLVECDSGRMLAAARVRL